MTLDSEGSAPAQPVIHLDSVGKCYRIYRRPEDRLKQAVLDRIDSIARARREGPRLYREHWALRDVSFDVGPGESVGILGRNGAGKSTLLQIIVGTLEPTCGTVETLGRITAMLELGSGFNPEFTGRENVYVNAAILGLDRAQTEERLDDILAFADIGDFVDQPVKMYSSGMTMRLAFAVQTAVQPKILIVDEALGVGDMFFQAKCMARLKELTDSGVSLLFVSHDVGTVRQICQRAVLVQEGRIEAIGSAASVADRYVRLQLEDRNRSAAAIVGSVVPEPLVEPSSPPEDIAAVPSRSPAVAMPARQSAAFEGFDSRARRAFDEQFGADSFALRARHNRVGNGAAAIRNVQMLRAGAHALNFDFDDEVTVLVYVSFDRTLTNLNHALTVRTLQGVDLLFFDCRLQDKMERTYPGGSSVVFEWRIRFPLMHGSYALSVGLAHPPDDDRSDWAFVDMVPLAYEFSMAPRGAGMIGGLVALPARLDVHDGPDWAD
jgi:lipopolysaccharide transport system ATP-binding protein